MKRLYGLLLGCLLALPLHVYTEQQQERLGTIAPNTCLSLAVMQSLKNSNPSLALAFATEFAYALANSDDEYERTELHQKVLEYLTYQILPTILLSQEQQDNSSEAISIEVQVPAALRPTQEDNQEATANEQPVSSDDNEHREDTISEFAARSLATFMKIKDSDPEGALRFAIAIAQKLQTSTNQKDRDVCEILCEYIKQRYQEHMQDGSPNEESQNSQ